MIASDDGIYEYAGYSQQALRFHLMKRATYKKINYFVKSLTAYAALITCYGGIFFAKTFLMAVLIIILGFLPYLIGYNILVRGWLFRNIDD